MKPRDVEAEELSKDSRWPDESVFTVGHSTLPIERFIALLDAYGIRRLADVRTVPRSRRNPQFNADALASALRAQSIEYVPLPALGGLRHARKDSANTGWRNESFRGYADYMQTQAFADGLDALIRMSRELRTAIMCAEAVPWRCHRSLIADALILRGNPVEHIMSKTRRSRHELTAWARVDGNSITYPPEPAEVNLDAGGHEHL